MSDKDPARVGLLRALLRALIGEWGYDNVRTQLGALSPEQPVSKELHDPKRLGIRAGERKRGAHKPSASAMAEKVALPPNKKLLVSQLAMQFDNKQFLPSIGDIRYFFEVHGEAEIPAKQRSESFRQVLRLLSSMEEDKLRQIIERSSHSGPSLLGPLSEALRGVSNERFQLGNLLEEKKEE